MTTREKVYGLLKKSGSVYISGQQIADQLYLTRAAVWKAIKALQKEGYQIDAVTNKGYRLQEKTVLPDAERIRELLLQSRTADSLLAEELEKLPVLVFGQVASTNDTAMEYAQDGEETERVIIAGKQTSGKGRRGRVFFSPDRTGMYMSFLLYPHWPFTKAIRLTCMMAVAVCRAILEVTGIETQIKWVNDIYYREKKIVGILTEGRTSMEDGTLSHVVVGAGINLYMPYDGFPDELRAQAGSLLEDCPDAEVMNALYASVIRHFFRLYRDPDEQAFIEEYRRRSMLIGHYVKIMNFSGNEKMPGNEYAFVTGIDDECRLQIRYDNGHTDALSSGEVSVVRY